MRRGHTFYARLPRHATSGTASAATRMIGATAAASGATRCLSRCVTNSLPCSPYVASASHIALSARRERSRATPRGYAA